MRAGIPFQPAEKITKKAQSRFSEMLAAVLKERASKFVSAENALRLRHGIEWSHGAGDEVGCLNSHSAEIVVSFERLAKFDLSLISETLSAMESALASQLESQFYQVAQESCENSGQIVSGLDFSQGFIEALRKISFSVGADGKVQLPSVHVGTGFPVESLGNIPEKTQEVIRELIKEKSAQAISDEKARLARFASAE